MSLSWCFIEEPLKLLMALCVHQSPNAEAFWFWTEAQLSATFRQYRSMLLSVQLDFWQLNIRVIYPKRTSGKKYHGELPAYVYLLPGLWWSSQLASVVESGTIMMVSFSWRKNCENKKINMSGASERQEEKKEIVKTQLSEKWAWRVSGENNNTFYK